MGGFTLVEVMVTAAVAAILVCLGTPSFMGLMTRHAAIDRAEALQDAVRVGRTEAMKRGGPVILCRTAAADTARCAGGGGSWQTWLLFADANRSGDFDNGDAVVRQQAAASNRLAVTSAAASIRFESTGIAHSDAGVTVFELGPAGGATALQRVCVNPRAEVVVIAGDATCP